MRRFARLRARAPWPLKYFGSIAASAFLSTWAIGGAFAETVTPVFQRALPATEAKAFSVVTVDFAPASQSVPHRHGQAFVYAYVLQGAIRSQLEGQPAQNYVAGQSWHEDPGSHHVLTENSSASEPARLLVVFVADIGAALKIDDSSSGAK
jgi:quercetin dioxygenase-like cupin family protein